MAAQQRQMFHRVRLPQRRLLAAAPQMTLRQRKQRLQLLLPAQHTRLMTARSRHVLSSQLCPPGRQHAQRSRGGYLLRQLCGQGLLRRRQPQTVWYLPLASLHPSPGQPPGQMAARQLVMKLQAAAHGRHSCLAAQPSPAVQMPHSSRQQAAGSSRRSGWQQMGRSRACSSQQVRDRHGGCSCRQPGT